MSEELHLGDGDPVEMSVQSVPNSWELIDFESAFELVLTNDRKVSSSEYLPAGILPVVDQGQQFIGGFTDKVGLAIGPDDGLLVFSDHTRIFNPIDFPFAAGADGIKILKPRAASMKYSFYACSSLQFPTKGYARHYSHLRKCKFPLAPQQEQTRIVSKIDELFNQIENGERALERVRTLVERYRQSVLKAAVTGELTREWRERHAGELESGEALLTRIHEARRQAWETAELSKMKAKKQPPVNDLWKRKYKEPVRPESKAFQDALLLERIAAERAAAASGVSAVKQGRGKRGFPSGMTTRKAATRKSDVENLQAALEQFAAVAEALRLKGMAEEPM